MQQQQFIEILKQPGQLSPNHLPELEQILNAYPFFESAHLLYTKALHNFQPIDYSRQLRKTAIVANSRGVLYNFLNKSVVEQVHLIEEQQSPVKEVQPEPERSISPVTVTNSDVKIIYVNTVSDQKVLSVKEPEIPETVNSEIEIVKEIENETSSSDTGFDVDKLNKAIEHEIGQQIIESYVQTDILNTPGLERKEQKEPSSFTDWLKALQKESSSFQIVQKGSLEVTKKPDNQKKAEEKDKKSSVLDQKKLLIDKIIESDPGRIKLGSNKFFTPAADAKQSLLENEHLVTETLAKIYALQGNISKAIRAYEILSLKFPQKSVYFASLIEKLKTNK
jgi:hypothetical protein